jgi:hypothetical protein
MKKAKTIRKPAALLWTLLLCVLALNQGYAQESAARRRISGKVTGKLGEESIASASVTIKGTTKSVTTNATGRFYH